MNATRCAPIVPCSLAAALALAVAIGIASAQSTPPAPAPPPSNDPPSEHDALRGPAVRDAAQERASLVRRDFAGKLVRIEARPEQAALELLTLTDDERDRVDAIMAERAVLIDSLLTDHYDLFLKLQNVRQSGAMRQGQGAEGFALIRQFREAAGPLATDRLSDRIEVSLAPENAAEFRRMVDEYFAALAVEEPPRFAQRRARDAGTGTAPMDDARPRLFDDSSPDGDARPSNPSRESSKPSRDPAAPNRLDTLRMEVNLLLREVGRSLSTIVDERRERADEFLDAIEATPEQRERILRLFREQTAEVGRKPSRTDRAALIRDVLKELTPEQRKVALKTFRDRAGGE